MRPAGRAARFAGLPAGNEEGPTPMQQGWYSRGAKNPGTLVPVAVLPRPPYTVSSLTPFHPREIGAMEWRM